jgi:hypothetical protein
MHRAVVAAHPQILRVLVVPPVHHARRRGVEGSNVHCCCRAQTDRTADAQVAQITASRAPLEGVGHTPDFKDTQPHDDVSVRIQCIRAVRRRADCLALCRTLNIGGGGICACLLSLLFRAASLADSRAKNATSATAAMLVCCCGAAEMS